MLLCEDSLRMVNSSIRHERDLLEWLADDWRESSCLDGPF